ncbi:tripartite tricarboxylate transporter TctB family protein [Acuticoccus sp. M5D2P5]|uniref:tripartite tricarboxylate transporter TctB family protein n=1 Tax=Acuticoccus kalidii TaxID=2910977 RepID=UPI001F3D55F8|nr:tripartite tricarboxylate transporter TctB family protein [Acuticoccus kalidii]MCF3936171.1 tripartite tricarboxylate transporter TctB family protein [Acuticoccus kalidii]
MTDRKENLLGGALFLIFGLAAYVYARSIPRRAPVGIDSGFLPEIVALAIAVLGAVLLVRSLPRRGRTDGDADRAPDAGEAERIVWLTLGLTVAAIAGYIVLLPIAGFVIATALYLFVQLVIFASRSPRALLYAALFSIVTSVAAWGLFRHGFGLILPHGLWG